MTLARSAIALLLVVAALVSVGISFVSLAHTDGHTSGCELSVGGASFCLMSFHDLSALAKELAHGQPLLAFLVLLAIVPVIAQNLLLFKPKRQRFRPKKPPRAGPVSLYTLLFAQGILNPKAP